MSMPVCIYVISYHKSWHIICLGAIRILAEGGDLSNNWSFWAHPLFCRHAAHFVQSAIEFCRTQESESLGTTPLSASESEFSPNFVDLTICIPLAIHQILWSDSQELNPLPDYMSLPKLRIQHSSKLQWQARVHRLAFSRSKGWTSKVVTFLFFLLHNSIQVWLVALPRFWRGIIYLLLYMGRFID